MRYRYQVGEEIYELSIERRGEAYFAALDGATYEFEILSAQPGILNLCFQGKPLRLYWAEENGKKWVSLEGCTYLLEKPTPRSARKMGEDALQDVVRSPMPAQVQEILVVEGEAVEKGQTLVLLEAMKMEIRLQAPYEGRVAKITAEVGQSVDRDQVLVELKQD